GEAWQRITADLESYAPRELLFPGSLEPLIRAGIGAPPHTAPLPLNEGEQPVAVTAPEGFASAVLTPLDDWLWQLDSAQALLTNQFGTQSLDGYGLTGKKEAIMAAGACLRYAQDTQRAAATHIRDIVYFEPQDHLVLDATTVRN